MLVKASRSMVSASLPFQNTWGKKEQYKKTKSQRTGDETELKERLVGQVSNNMTAPPALPLTEQTGDSCIASTNTPECPRLQSFKQIYKKKRKKKKKKERI